MTGSATGLRPLIVRPFAPLVGEIATMAQILVVDDDEAIRSMLAFALQDEGYDVVTAKNGIEAFEQILRMPLSLILLDVEMPVMDGVTLAQSVREQGVHVPIVFMSAGDRARDAAERAQAAGYLVKPFSLETLYKVVAGIATAESPQPG